MGLPTGRDLTATALSPLPSALTNHIQDEIVRLHQRTTGVPNSTSGGQPVVIADPISLPGGIAGSPVVAGTLTANQIVSTNNVAATFNVQAGAKLTAGTNCEIAGDFQGASAHIGGVVSAAEYARSGSRKRWRYAACGQYDPSVWTPSSAQEPGLQYIGAVQDSVKIELDVETGDRIVNLLIDWANADTSVVARVFLRRSDASGPTAVTTPDLVATIVNVGRAVSVYAVNVNVLSDSGYYVIASPSTDGITSGAMKVFRAGVEVIRP